MADKPDPGEDAPRAKPKKPTKTKVAKPSAAKKRTKQRQPRLALTPKLALTMNAWTTRIWPMRLRRQVTASR
jgi:hypothetical protein